MYLEAVDVTWELTKQTDSGKMCGTPSRACDDRYAGWVRRELTASVDAVDREVAWRAV